MVNCNSWADVKAAAESAKAQDDNLFGAGVVAAFLLMATITVLVVVLGYVFDCLDDAILSDLDHRIITRLHSLVGAKCPRQKGASSVDASHRTIRKEVTTRFILALSDQQLVTGLAILIAGNASRQSLLGYQYSVIQSLALFSATTHLATLDTLRTYLTSRRGLLHVRLACMLAILILLSYTFVIKSTIAIYNAPLACSRGTYRASDNVPIIVLNWTDFLWGILDFSAHFLILLFTLRSYLLRIENLYMFQREPLYLFTALIWRASKRRTHCMKHSTFALEVEAYHRTQGVMRSEGIRGKRRAGWTVVYALRSYHSSFLSSLPSIIFTYTYGVGQLYLEGKFYSGSYRSSSSVDFAQILTILLLALPFLAAWETYSDYHILSSAKRTDTVDFENMHPRTLSTRRQSAPDINHDARPSRHSHTEAELRERYERPARYFPKEYRLLVTEISHKNARLAAKQRELLSQKAKTLEEIEGRVGIPVAIYAFAMETVLAILVPILLNIETPYAMPYANLVALAICFLVLLIEIIRTAWKGLKICTAWRRINKLPDKYGIDPEQSTSGGGAVAREITA